ncbi:secreted in xylem 2 [Fusarium tjaetaba]|uniref:Secreted in xylem 2 n=1 Tax=Fusarium tjaetaba TaxID=1567544 RepID=A0A8H5VHJ6_9HYPO|nr:secreted in xylem 2 [Fusarium tjaetaba]KAF5622400.1 secreted in xylem 2 [Fusarium tjaetaba]
MFFKRALVALFAAWTISVAANPVADPLPDDIYLPDLRLSPREVQDLKDNQKFPPGYVHKMVTFGTGEDTTTVPIVEADPDMLLDDEKGMKARSLAPRGSCFSFPMPSSGCMIDYCWIDSGGHTYSAAITIRGSNGQSNPSSVTSNDPANLSLNNVFNDGYNDRISCGENIAYTIGNVVRDWCVDSKLGVSICDNVASNDICLRNLYTTLDASITAADTEAQRLRCFGHILNLVAQTFLYGDDIASFKLQSEAYDMLERVEENLEPWRAKGLVRKLYNSVKFIRPSPQCTEAFKAYAREQEEIDTYKLTEESTAEIEVIQNNATRWYSTYMVIERALVQ